MLIVNPHGNNSEQHPGQQAGHPHAGQMNGLTPLPPPTSSEVNGHLLHNTAGGSTRSSETSSNSPMDGLASNVGASPVSSAVRSLTNLSDFSLDVSNGNYDNYGGITDSLLSAEASKDVKVETTNATSHSGGQQRGPLLDFKSAFSDLDSKPSDLRLIFILKSRPVHL